ncbi:MAG TPA: 50S ribosomal protein L3 [Dehalococcoidia bacterium]|nr:50S ribosomal protein L3 [Dehalococcoidia bacterium]
MEGLLGRKLGMTQTFAVDGTVTPVTVIEAGPCAVTQVKTVANDGYAAVQLGYGNARRLSKPLKGHLRGLGDFRYLREFNAEDPSQWKVGQRVLADIFRPGDFVDVIGTSKGKGFAGGVKRYGFAGGPKTHGQSDRHRAPGSIGATTYPGKVVKGQRMAGHMGHRRVTVRNLRVVAVDEAKGLLLIQGSVPGADGELVRVRRAIRPPKGSRG